MQSPWLVQNISIIVKGEQTMTLHMKTETTYFAAIIFLKNCTLGCHFVRIVTSQYYLLFLWHFHIYQLVLHTPSPLTKSEDFECLWYFLPWDHIDTKCSSSVVEDKKQSGSWYLGSSYLAAAEKFSCSIHSHSVTYDVNYIWHLIKIKINIDPCYLCMIVFL